MRLSREIRYPAGVFAMVSGLAGSTSAGEVAMVPSKGHEIVRATITNPSMERFSVNIPYAENMRVDMRAPNFIFLTVQPIPAKCVDGRNGIAGRVKNNFLSADVIASFAEAKNPVELRQAILDTGCVLIKNPKAPGGPQILAVN